MATKQASPNSAPQNKPTGPAVIMQQIPDAEMEMFYAIGFLRGTNHALADRFAELFLEVINHKNALITQALGTVTQIKPEEE